MKFCQYVIVCLIVLTAPLYLMANGHDQRVAIEWDSVKTLWKQAFFYGNMNDAARHSEALLQVGRESGNDSLVCLALMIKSTVINDPEKSLQAFEEAIKAAERLGNADMLVTVKGNFAINRFTVGDVKKAYSITKEILVIADSLNNDHAREQACINLAQIYNYTGDNEKAIEQLHILLRVLKTNKRTKALLSLRSAQAYAGIGRCYGRLNVKDSAEWYLQQALQIARSEGLSDMMLRGYIELASYYGKNESPSPPDLRLMRTALDSASFHLKSGDWNLLNQFKIYEAKYLLLSGHQRKCIHLASTLLPESETKGDMETVRNLRELLYIAHSQLKEYEPAFEHLIILNALRDSVQKNELAGKLAIYEVDRQTKEKEIENLNLRRKSELDRQRTLLIGVGGMVALVLAVMALIFARSAYLQAQKNEQLNVRLVHINSRLERFVSTVSHDVLSNIDLLLSWGNMIHSSKNTKTGLEAYYSQAHQIHAQIKAYCLGLLKESRTPVSAVDSYYDPTEVLQKVLDRFEISLKEAGLRVITQRPLSLVQIPPVIVEQIFQNLISNAIKYGAGAQHPTLQIAEEQDALQRKRWIVEDNGTGIPRHLLETIFEKSERPGAHGQGVGLSLLRSNLQEYGWDIVAESGPDEGARFVIYLN